MSTEQATRPPYRRYAANLTKEDLEMNLPEGKTCGDCVHSRRCSLIFGRIPADEVCDWYPSRFQAKAAATGADHG